MKNLGKMDLIKGIEIFLELNKKKVVTYEEAEIMFNILNSADLKAVQNYGAYTEKEQWLFEIFLKRLYGSVGAWHERVHPEYFEGVKRLGLGFNLFEIYEVSRRMESFTGFGLYPVPGHTKEPIFILGLRKKRFPMTMWFRDEKDLDYIEEPEMGHEGPGHSPLLTNQPYADATVDFANAYFNLHNNLPKSSFDIFTEAMARFYWWTFEFGLTKYKGENRIYGCGIASSYGETLYCLTDEAEKYELPNDPVEAVKILIDTPFKLDEHTKNESGQEYFRKYFITPNFGHFCEMNSVLEKVVGEKIIKEFS